MTDFSLRPDDAGGTKISGRENSCTLVYPDMLGYLVIFCGIQRFSQIKDHILDAGQCFPGIGKAQKIVLCQRVVEVVKIFNCIHT